MKVNEGERAVWRSLTCAILLCLNSMVHASAGDNNQSIEFSWLPCVENAVPYFSALVSSDGEARYTGRSGAKFDGDRDLAISTDGSRQLVKAGKKLIRSAAKRQSSTDISDKHAGSRTCLAVSLPNGERRVKLNLFDPRAKRFDELAQKLTAYRKLVCPGGVGQLSGDGVCDAPLIWFTFEKTAPCLATHWILVYGNGDVLHTINHSSRGEFFAMSRDSAIELAHRSLEFEVLRDSSIEEQSGKPRYIRGSSSELNWFEQEVSTRSGVTWDALSAAPEACSLTYTKYDVDLGVFVDEDALAKAAPVTR